MHNGFKYKSCGDVGLIVKIQELYPFVYQKTKIPSNSISINFTYGLLVERKRTRSQPP
jgi:hypothetical protein